MPNHGIFVKSMDIDQGYDEADFWPFEMFGQGEFAKVNALRGQCPLWPKADCGRTLRHVREVPEATSMALERA
jgi:hypothetical protein